MALSTRKIKGLLLGIGTPGGSIKDILGKARQYLGQGIARTSGGISLRLLLEAVEVHPPPTIGVVDYPPGIPTQVTAVAEDAQARVTWQAPSSDGGEPIPKYTIKTWHELQPIGFNTTTDGNARSAVVTGLTNGVSYYFNVWATNHAGDGLGKASNVVIPTSSQPLPGCTWFYFQVDNPMSDLLPCSMWAQCAMDEATAQQYVQNLNVGATVTQVDYSTYVQGCS